MAQITIDVEDNSADLSAATSALSTAVTNLQNSTLAGLPQALTDLETAVTAVVGFQISFTANVVPAA